MSRAGCTPEAAVPIIAPMGRLIPPLLALAILSSAVGARADEPIPPAADVDTAKEQARAKYAEGVGLVKRAQWSDALATFEAAAKLYPNASITLNMGACERALGRYLRARSTLQRALDESSAATTPLPESSALEA